MRAPLILCCCLCLSFPVLAEELIWVEGESSSAHSMKRHGWYDSVKKVELSGNEWLSHFAKGEKPGASYPVNAASAGRHEFWLRANPVGSALSIRLNGGAWQAVDTRNHQQSVNIASDGKPDLRFVAWIKAAPLDLKAGGNTVEIRFDSDNHRHGGLDCFVLSREPFVPDGKRKPGQKLGLADPGTWAFEPGPDRFEPEALLDLSSLNETPAGRSGYLQRSKEGDFLDGAGRPLRFWAVNTTVQNTADLDTLERHARWLAKRGVNMVRHHGHLAPKGGAPFAEPDRAEIERIWRLVAAMKKHGIYTTISIYWAVAVKYQAGSGLANPGGENLTGLLFYDETLQAAYKAWWKALMLPPNPHTGLPLAKDPAVGIVQLQNEDSLLFWTEQAIKNEQRRALGRRFGDFLIKKYGSLAKTRQAWGGAAGNTEDAFEDGLVMPHGIWHVTQSQAGPMRARLNDQVEFYTRLMYDFNADMGRFFRQELGCKALVNAGNWRTASQAKLLDCERYSYSANEVIGVNRYYTSGHRNPTDKHRAGYLISRGDRISNVSALLRPGHFPLALRQVAGHPMIIPESAWVPPLRYQTEGPFLVAAYGALTGVDIYYWFSTGDVGFGRPMGKWQASTPTQFGMFPAAALMFRRGDVRRGAPALQERRPLTGLWSRQAPQLPEEAGFDPNRDAGLAPEGLAEPDSPVSPLAYLVGPVEVGFGGEAPASRTADLAQYIGKKSPTTVTSITGELDWDYGTGICTLNSPKAQGVTGFLAKAGALRTEDLLVDSENEYATLLAVSLDNRPLRGSDKVLIQVGTVARPYGWRTETRGRELEITKLGGALWNVTETQATVLIRNQRLTRARALDANGMPTRELKGSHGEHGYRLTLPPDALYVVLDRP